MIYAEVAWVLVSSGTQVQPQIILDPDYLPDYLSVSYDYGNKYKKLILMRDFNMTTSNPNLYQFLHTFALKIPKQLLLIIPKIKVASIFYW